MKVLLFIYQWCIAAPIIVVATIIVALATIIGSYLGSGTWWGYHPPRLWGKLFCLLMFVRVTVSGRENIDKKTSYVFIANHQGAYDIFSIYGYLNHNFRWMMKKSLGNIPFVGSACKVSGQIFVDNKSASGVAHTMQEAKERLKQGLSLVVFPEGARSWTGKMRPFKRGAFKLAIDFNLPIVPVTIDGSFKVMPRTTYLIKPGHIHLTIHKPIGINVDNIDAVMEESYKVIESALPDCDKN